MKELENKLKLNIQLFAEEGAEGTAATAENTEGDTANSKESKPLTFDEMLKQENYQSEFDKRVAKGIETAQTKWQNDYQAKLEAQKTEAEKLAKMNAEQKLTYEKEQAEKKAQEIQAKLNAYELKDQALQVAKEKNIDVSLLSLIDFAKETADTVNVKLDTINKTFNTAVENAMNNKLKQKTPMEAKNSKSASDPYLDGFNSI